MGSSNRVQSLSIVGAVECRNMMQLFGYPKQAQSPAQTAQQRPPAQKTKPVVHARNLIFCGNPGAGKSTLLNGLVGKVEFKSGVSVGKGLTFQFDKCQCADGLTYMDTPGLSDVKLRKQAADAIAQALRSGGFYRVFFVVTLEAGRFKADDLTTIRLVLGASQDIRDYGLIINKVSKRVAKVLEDKDQMNNLLDLIFNDPKIPRTNNVHVVVFEAELNDEDDIYLEAKPELKQFIQGVKDSYVVGEEVEDLKIDEFEQLQAKA